MVVFPFIFKILHGPPLSYLHAKNLRKHEEIDAHTNNDSAGLNNKNMLNSVSIFSHSVAMNNIF